MTEILEGYQQTELGIIPIDWKVKELSLIVENERPISYGIVQTGKYIENGIQCIRVIDLVSGKVRKNNLIRTSEEISISYRRTILRAGDVVIALRGKIGELAVIEKDLAGANLTRGLALIAPIEGNHNYFLYYYLSSPQSKLILEKNLNGSALKEIPIGVLRKIPVPLPPTIEEQKAIAQALSDVDAAIAELDRLITKKRNIKQGTMQQLLTGKQRLPGFSNEWEEKKLGDIGSFYSGGTPNTFNPSFYGGDIPWITSGDLNSRRVRSVDGRITQKGLESSSAKLIKKNTLLIALYGATSGVTAISEIDAAINQAVLAIILKSDCTEFFFHKLTSIKDWIIKTYTQGGQPNLSGNIVKSIGLAIPVIEEQRAIAQVLTDMDAEIEALEQKRDKYKAIKQGMMQELLTGRTRLV